MLTRIASVLLLLLVATPVRSLENIQNVYWFIDIGGNPGRSVSLVSFDADITAADHAAGLTYTIAERDENGGPGAPIWHYVLAAFPDLPPVGTRANVKCGFEFYCDADGRLLPIEPTTTTWVSYCAVNDTAVGSYALGVGNGSMASSFPVEEYEFSLVDEHGVLAPTATPANVFIPCVEAPGGVAAGPSVMERMARFWQDHINAAQKPGDSGSVGLYFDAQGTICSGTIQPGVPQKIYVIAKTRGLSECGIAGAEFRFTGIPQSWQVHPVARVGIAFGNPLVEGALLGMPCQNPEENLVILYEVDVVATQLEENVTFRLEPHLNPVGSFSCPLLVLCDSPHFTQICVESFPCHFNPSSPKGCEGTVAMVKQTWSAVKELYRRP